MLSIDIDIDVEGILEHHLAVALGRLRLPPNQGYGSGYEEFFRQGFEPGLQGRL